MSWNQNHPQKIETLWLYELTFLTSLGFKFTKLVGRDEKKEKCRIEILIFNGHFTFTGISNIAGKLVTGRFSDISCINTFLLSNVYIFMSGVSACCFPFCNSYELFVIISISYGFFSTFFSLKNVILVELLGLDILTSAYCLIGKALL